MDKQLILMLIKYFFDEAEKQEIAGNKTNVLNIHFVIYYLYQLYSG